MKLTLMMTIAAILAAPVFAERTKKELVKATTPEQDAKENSDAVPDVYAIPAQIKNVLILRFKYKADLLAGIEEMVKKNKIRNAVFLSGIGSVRNSHIHGVSNRTFPSKNMFVKDDSNPADIISINGYVIEGRVHAHMTLADDEKAFGGHIEPGNPVFTFAIVTLGILEDNVTLDKVDDKTYR
ncbi:MAG: DNA-binding protein [Acidobacteria bacterium]|nr:DNA-binding protein [Acidobacteriota bacterium]